MASLGPFHYRYEPATRPGPPPLLLLHGTGGDETDLLPLGRALAPGAALLSPRGPVLEAGLPRFFRRLAEGVFDEDDVRRRAADLATFVAQARATHDLVAPIAVGFSNGANIAAAMLMLHPETLGGAVLLRAMPPLANPPSTRIEGTPVFILSGDADTIVPKGSAAHLASSLARMGARVRHDWVTAGHRLGREDVERAAAWIDVVERSTARLPFHLEQTSFILIKQNNIAVTSWSISKNRVNKVANCQ